MLAEVLLLFFILAGNAFMILGMIRELIKLRAQIAYFQNLLMPGVKMVTLAKDFTPEQKKLANELLDQLKETSEEVNEFSTVRVYGLQDKGYDADDDRMVTSVLFEIEYSDPEGEGPTIFDSY